MLERLRNEPALVLVVAAAVIVLGIDLADLAEAVERLLQVLTIAGAGVATRQQVTPTRKL